MQRIKCLPKSAVLVTCPDCKPELTKFRFWGTVRTQTLYFECLTCGELFRRNIKREK